MMASSSEITRQILALLAQEPQTEAILRQVSYLDMVRREAQQQQQQAPAGSNNLLFFASYSLLHFNLPPLTFINHLLVFFPVLINYIIIYINVVLDFLLTTLLMKAHVFY